MSRHDPGGDVGADVPRADGVVASEQISKFALVAVVAIKVKGRE